MIAKRDKIDILLFIKEIDGEVIKIFESEIGRELSSDDIPSCFGVYYSEIPGDCQKDGKDCIIRNSCKKLKEIKIKNKKVKDDALIKKVSSSKKSKRRPKGFVKSKIVEMLKEGTTLEKLNQFIKEIGYGKSSMIATLTQLRKMGKLVEDEKGNLKLEGEIINNKKVKKGEIKNFIMNMLKEGHNKSEIEKGLIDKFGTGLLQLYKVLNDLKKKGKLVEDEKGILKLK